VPADNDGEYPALKRLVMKGVTTKAKAREALEELEALIEALQTQYDALEGGVCDWEEGDDAETRAEGKEQVEEVVTDLDSPLTSAGRACGMTEYEPSD
jgi:exonuclease VII small subunit